MFDGADGVSVGACDGFVGGFEGCTVGISVAGFEVGSLDGLTVGFLDGFSVVGKAEGELGCKLG
jgi:hypothetical protein